MCLRRHPPQLTELYESVWAPLEAAEGFGGRGRRLTWRSRHVQGLEPNTFHQRWFRVRSLMGLVDRTAAVQHCPTLVAARRLDDDFACFDISLTQVFEAMYNGTVDRRMGAHCCACFLGAQGAWCGGCGLAPRSSSGWADLAWVPPAWLPWLRCSCAAGRLPKRLPISRPPTLTNLPPCCPCPPPADLFKQVEEQRMQFSSSCPLNPLLSGNWRSRLAYRCFMSEVERRLQEERRLEADLEERRLEGAPPDLPYRPHPALARRELLRRVAAQVLRERHPGSTRVVPRWRGDWMQVPA